MKEKNKGKKGRNVAQVFISFCPVNCRSGPSETVGRRIFARQLYIHVFFLFGLGCATKMYKRNSFTGTDLIAMMLRNDEREKRRYTLYPLCATFPENLSTKKHKTRLFSICIRATKKKLCRKNAHHEKRWTANLIKLVIVVGVVAVEVVVVEVAVAEAVVVEVVVEVAVEVVVERVVAGSVVAADQVVVV
jgi:hypothetical protein